MKTSIAVDIDDVLLADALKTTGLATTDQVIELALQKLIQLKRQENIKTMYGKLNWDGDLDLMRTNL